MRGTNGDGTIGRRADGRWEARYVLKVGEKWERRSIYGKTRTEVRQRLKEALAARDAGLTPAKARETIDAYLLTWVAGVEPTLRARTADSYRQIVTSHLVPAFRRVPLSRLTPQLVQRTYRDLLDQGLSAKTISNVHGVLHKALDQAYRWRLVPSNVADLVDPPRIPRREMKALTPDEARQVLAAAEG